MKAYLHFNIINSQFIAAPNWGAELKDQKLIQPIWKWKSLPHKERTTSYSGLSRETLDATMEAQIKNMKEKFGNLFIINEGE